MPLKHSVKEIVLKNGSRGLLVDVPDSTVASYTIHFRAGNDYVSDASKHQTAHLMEHMAFGPNEKYNSMEEFSQAFSENGAYSNASTFDTNMHYYADCADFEWDRILELQKLAVAKPKFLPEILESEKGNVREELTGRLHNNARHLWQKINRHMGGHSLLDSEKIETIDNVTVEDIADHHRSTHTLENMRFVLAGNFSGREEKVRQIMESFDLPRGERLPVKEDDIKASSAVSIRRQDQENITFAFTMMLRRELSPQEIVVMSALDHILTGSMHSCIFGKARKAGVCYGMGSHTSSNLGNTSSWDFNGQVRPENATRLYKMIVDELTKVAQGEIDESYIVAAKKSLTGGFQMRGQTVSGLGSWYAGEYFFSGDVADVADELKYIENITKDSIVSLAREFMAAGIWTLGEIGKVDQSETDSRYEIFKPLFEV